MSSYFCIIAVSVISNPCNPSPCGPNSQCREINNVAVCSCVPGYSGNPPTCRPECTTSAECPLHKACNNYKCINPCIGACGAGALCEVVNHNPICSCPNDYTGDPFSRCIRKRKYFLTQHICCVVLFIIGINILETFCSLLTHCIF